MKTKTKRIYDRVFQHPMTHNLEWRDIKSLFEETGEVEIEHNGNLKVTVDGHTMVFQSPVDSENATSDEVNQIRHLFQNHAVRTTEVESDFLVVINHSEAHIYRLGAKGGDAETVLPYDPDQTKSHVHSHHVNSSQGEKVNYDAYFGDVADSLRDAHRIVVFGSGRGSSGAMENFVKWIPEHRNPIADRIAASLVIDESHLTEGEILVKGREVFAGLPPSAEE